MATYRDDWRLTACFKGIGVIALVGRFAIASENPALAQSRIIPDATLGAESSVVVPNYKGLPVEAIAGGAQRGQNLFHSFKEFNVSEGRGAYFFSPNTAIQNILARVTGSNRSEILGVLGTFGNSQPNLFLINPNGIIFGQNAQLDVGGSFVGSTANSLVFGNGFEFSATPPQRVPLLTVNLPLGLQYGSNPGGIQVQGATLQVAQGQTLALVGGNVQLDNAVLFVGGRIELGGVATRGTVRLNESNNSLSLKFPRSTVRADVSLNGSKVGNLASNGGSIAINAHNLNLVGSLLGIGINQGSPQSQLGDIDINASGDVTLTNGSLIGDSSLLDVGKAGDIRIKAESVFVGDGSGVSTITITGTGGNLTVNATDLVLLSGVSADGTTPSTLTTGTNGTGNAGNLTIKTGALLVQGGAQIFTSTLGSGNAGNLTVNAADKVQLIGASVDGQYTSGLFASTQGTGKAGDLTITTGQLLIADRAQVSTNTSGAGKGGNLTVNASDLVQVIGSSRNGKFDSLLTTQARSDSSGNAGNLTITTRQLLIADGAQVSASTFGAGNGGSLTVNASDLVQVIGSSRNGKFDSLLTTQAGSDSSGNAGNLTITTGQLLVAHGAQVSANTFSSGNSGNLTVNATDKVQLIGTSIDGQIPSGLFTATQGTGKAGDLTITTQQLLVSGGAEATAGTLSTGHGGSLIVNATDKVQLSGADTGLFVNATAGGTAGRLSVTTEQMSVSDGAQVSVSSPFGQAGNLNIMAESLTLNRGQVTAETAKSGASGGANINLEGLNLLRMDNESLISANALEQANGGNVKIDSTFIVATLPTGSKGSDITANAYQGNGGRVNITTQGLFGTQFRPKQTPDNDITASSEFGINGEVTINQPNVDPRRGLSELPTTVVDATRQIDRRCNPTRADQRSSFVITGRGGLPPSPNDPLQDEAVVNNWVTLDSKTENTKSEVPKANPTNTAPKQLVEAQSWVYDPDGRVILVAQAPTATPQSPWQPSPSCRDLQPSADSRNATSER